MDRLTKPCRNTEGGKYIDHVAGDFIGIYPDCTLGKVVDRLAAYEATGLTPEEIVALRSTLAEYHKDADPLLRAKAEDRLVVLPCRMNATVYDIRRFYNRSKVVRREIVSGQIDHFTIGDAGVPIATVCLHGNEWVDYEPSELMLTPKDAETALKEEEAK